MFFLTDIRRKWVFRVGLDRLLLLYLFNLKNVSSSWKILLQKFECSKKICLSLKLCFSISLKKFFIFHIFECCKNILMSLICLFLWMRLKSFSNIFKILIHQSNFFKIMSAQLSLFLHGFYTILFKISKLNRITTFKKNLKTNFFTIMGLRLILF